MIGPILLLSLASGLGQLDDLIVVVLGLKVFAVAEEIEQLESRLVRLDDVGCQRGVEELVAEAVFARTAPFDLDEIGGRENRAQEAEVEEVRAVVAGGHHADGDADASFAGEIFRREVTGTEQIVIGKVDGELLGIGHLRRDLHGEVGLVFPRKHLVGHHIKNLGEPGRVALADCKDDGLAQFAADRIAQGVFEKGLAEQVVGGIGEEAIFQSRAFCTSPLVLRRFPLR